MSQHKEKICQQAKYNIFKTMLCKELKSNFREHLCTFNKIQEVKIEKKDISNTYYLENGSVKYTFDKLPNLATIKHDLSLIKDYDNRICYIESSRGCFYNCTYCLASSGK